MSDFKVEGWTEVEAMNALQDVGGIISDECVMWEDVAAENQAQAIEWLKENLSRGGESRPAGHSDKLSLPDMDIGVGNECARDVGWESRRPSPLRAAAQSPAGENTECRTLDHVSGSSAPPAQNSPAMDSVPCRKCKTPIVFLKSKSSGKSVPVDASTIKGRVWFYDPKAGHISHFATCTSPELFRNK